MLANNNKLVLKANDKSIADFLMFVGLTLEFIFQGTIISQTGFILALLGGAWCMLTTRPQKVHVCSFIVFYVLLIGYFGFRIVNGDSIAPDLSRSYLQTMVYCAVFMFFAYQYLTNRTLSEVTVLLSAVCIAVSAYLVLSGAIFRGNRMYGSGINANGIGGLCAATISLIGFQLATKKWKLNWHRALFILWLILVILLTGSRKSLFLCIMPLLIFYLLRQKREVIIRSVGATVFILIVYILIMNIEALYDIIGVRIEAMLSWLFTGETDDASMTSRARFIALGMENFRRYPWKGLGLFSFSTLSGAAGTYSHNNFVEMLVSGGIPALVLFYFPFVVLIFSKLKRAKSNKSELFLLIFIICSLVMHVAMVAFYSRIDLFIYLLAFAASNSQSNISQNDKNI